MNAIHPWHGVPVGDSSPEIVNGIVEIPKHSRAKYEIDKETGLLILDRVLYSAVYYPANYGFIPQTYCDDNDPLDIMILSQIPVVPLCIVPSKVIGVMRMIDNGEKDDKIIAVAQGDMSVAHLNDIEELPKHSLRELRSFFEDYKKLENKTVIVEDFQSKGTAMEIVEQSKRDYHAKIASGEIVAS